MKKSGKNISRIAGAKGKKPETRAIFTLETRDTPLEVGRRRKRPRLLTGCYVKILK